MTIGHSKKRSDRGAGSTGSLFLLVLISLALAASCHRGEKSRQKALIPADRSPFVDLGYGFDSRHGRVLPNKCMEATDPIIEKRETAPIMFFSDVVDKSAADILSRIKGSLTLSVPIYPGVDAGGDAAFATASAKTDSSTNRVYSTSQQFAREFPESALVRRETEYFRSIKAQASEMGLKDEAYRNFITERCGDEYIEKVSIGSSLVFVVNAEFGSKKNAEKYSAALTLSLLGGIGTARAGADIMMDSQSESILLTMSVRQVGGRPENISRLFPDGLPRCRFDKANTNGWSEECVQAMQALYGYATGASGSADVPSYPSQLAEGDSAFVPLFYVTRPYSGEVAEDEKVVGVSQYLTRLQGLETHRKVLANIAETRVDQTLGELFFLTVLDQISEVNDAVHEIKDEISRCWSGEKICSRDEAVSSLTQIMSSKKIDYSLTEYSELVPRFYDWCMKAGPLASGGVQFLNSRLFDDDSKLILNLYARVGLSPVTANPDGTFSKEMVEGSCRLFDQRMSDMTYLDLDFQRTRFAFPIRSLRMFNHFSTLSTLIASGHKLDSFPFLMETDSLAVLDLRGNPFDANDLAIGNLKTLPKTLRCLDIGRKGENLNNAIDVSQQILQHLSVPTVFMHNWPIYSLPNEAVKEIHIGRFGLAADEVKRLVTKRKSPLKIFVDDSALGYGTFGTVTIAEENFELKCQ
jgi:hypothetical protein